MTALDCIATHIAPKFGISMEMSAIFALGRALSYPLS
jgi:hypothetical protein